MKITEFSCFCGPRMASGARNQATIISLVGSQKDSELQPTH